MMISRLLPLALCLLGSEAWAAKADYIVRWDVTDKAALGGRPASADDVVAKLPQTTARRPAPATSAVTDYNDVQAPPGLPAGYETTLRRRERDGRFAFIYAVRGPGALPDRPPACSRIGADALPEQLDVAIGTVGDADQRSVTVACERVQRSNELPEGFEKPPAPRDCQISVTRHVVPWDKPGGADKPEQLRVEEWTYGGNRRIVELSWHTDDTPANEQMFRNLAGYVAAGIDVATSPDPEALSRNCGR